MNKNTDIIINLYMLYKNLIPYDRVTYITENPHIECIAYLDSVMGLIAFTMSSSFVGSN